MSPRIPQFISGPRLIDGDDLTALEGAIGSYAGGVLKGADMNSTGDQAITIALPPGCTRYAVSKIIASKPSISLTTAAGGIYTRAAKGGVQVVASAQAYSGLTQNLVDVAGSVLELTLNLGTAFFTEATLYLALTTAQGAAATCDFTVLITPLP